MKKLLSSLALLAFFAYGPAALAQPATTYAPASIYEGVARPWQLNFQAPATPVMEELYALHHGLLITITAITLFVLVLLIYICLRFRRARNPVPSKVTHNTRLEIIWTAIPILILIGIAIPSIRAHYMMQKVVESDMTIKVVGYQWYWHYEYPDHGGFGYDSYIKKDSDLQPGDHRLLSVDNNVVVPVNAKVRVLLTGGDVIHAWAVPAFGVKRDAVPGRLNETWFQATRTGTFYGQCSELCGVGHGFMPIAVSVVSQEEFDAWVKQKQEEAGIEPGSTAPLQKTTTPLTDPVSAKHKNPEPVIEKEKQISKPTASDNDPAKDKDGDPRTLGNENQPAPAKAAEETQGDAQDDH